MSKKKCTKCQIVKLLIEFRKCKSFKDGLQYICKECSIVQDKEYFKTKDGLITRIYKTQKSRSKLRNMNLPTYTKCELKEWLYNQELFHKLYNEWADSRYLKELVPSIDRKDDNKPYTMDNIQLMTWAENKTKGHIDMRNGKLIHGHKPQKAVYQYSKDNKFIAEYHSLAEASRQTGISQGNISECCNGKRKKAGGYVWSFTNE